jgi:hypothetical protein
MRAIKHLNINGCNRGNLPVILFNPFSMSVDLEINGQI